MRNYRSGSTSREIYSLYRRKEGEDVSISIKVENHKWDELDFRAGNTVHMFSAKNILANVHGMSSTKKLKEKTWKASISY